MKTMGQTCEDILQYLREKGWATNFAICCGVPNQDLAGGCRTHKHTLRVDRALQRLRKQGKIVSVPDPNSDKRYRGWALADWYRKEMGL